MDVQKLQYVHTYVRSTRYGYKTKIFSHGWVTTRENEGIERERLRTLAGICHV